jgi:hypothetical protein
MKGEALHELQFAIPWHCNALLHIDLLGPRFSGGKLKEASTYNCHAFSAQKEIPSGPIISAATVFTPLTLAVKVREDCRREHDLLSLATRFTVGLLNIEPVEAIICAGNAQDRSAISRYIFLQPNSD